MSVPSESRSRLGRLSAAPWQIALVAGAGSLGLLVAAFAFEHLGGLAPCPLCLWQRWPHGIAATAGLLAIALPVRPLAILGAAAMLVGAGLGLYHVGIEQAWWAGPAACAAPDVAGLTADELFERIMAAPVVRCDEIAWSLAGLSMAGWNALASLGLAGLWSVAALGSRGR